MANMKSWLPVTLNLQAVVHSSRTAFAAFVSLAVARAFRLPEAYWAAVTTLVIMQSTLGAALQVSRSRLEGTALGALVGALVASYFSPSALIFAAVVFALGLLAAALHLDLTAYRFASITVAIIMLVTRNRPAWVLATHRFIEVSIGIGVGLLLTALWPETPTATGQAETRPGSP